MPNGYDLVARGAVGRDREPASDRRPVLVDPEVMALDGFAAGMVRKILPNSQIEPILNCAGVDAGNPGRSRGPGAGYALDAPLQVYRQRWLG
jgi:hypothetical protein